MTIPLKKKPDIKKETTQNTSDTSSRVKYDPDSRLGRDIQSQVRRVDDVNKALIGDKDFSALTKQSNERIVAIRVDTTASVIYGVSKDGRDVAELYRRNGSDSQSVPWKEKAEKSLSENKALEDGFDVLPDGTVPYATVQKYHSRNESVSEQNIGNPGANTTTPPAPSTSSRLQKRSISDLNNQSGQVLDSGIDPFKSLSGQADAVFDQQPRPNLQKDAQQAFEQAFPALRPADLSKIVVNFWKWERPDPDSAAEPKLVSSRSAAEYITERYSGGPEISLQEDHHKNVFIGIYNSPDASGEQDQIQQIPVHKFETFINDLKADKAEDVSLEQKRYFETPGPDGKKPIANLGEIRQKQIQADAELQYSDGTLSEEGKALVESVVKNPSEADLERAYPDESKRPRVVALQIRNLDYDGDPIPAQYLQGPFVIMTPHADNLPGGKDRAVLFVPGKGLTEFKSLDKLKENFSSSSMSIDSTLQRNLLNFLTEPEQAGFSEHPQYQLEVARPPLRGNFFEHSVQQQIDKQGRDTEYRMERAGKRGVDLKELDGIMGESTDDLHESFGADGPLRERDLRLIELNRPDWWKTSSPKDKETLGVYQETADQLESNFEELESDIPTQDAYAAKKTREALQPKYPGIDPDKTTVTITYHQPPEPSNGAHRRPKPEPKTVTTTLTQYMVLDRRLAQNPPDDETGISGTILDSLAPGSDVAKLFRENKVSVTATLSDTDGKAITDRDGNAVTLDKPTLDALGKQLDVGKGYKKLLNDKYLGVNGQKLQATWKAAYRARMQVDLQEARMSGEIDARYDDKTPSSMVQAVLKSPDSKNREKVNGHDIQTEEFTVDIERKFPLPSSVSVSYPVNGVLVIGAADKGLSTAVLCTPDAPDGKAFRTYLSREDMKQDPMFKKPEWIAYFKGRVSHGKVPVSREKNMTEQEGIGLYAKPDPKLNYEAKFNTKVVKVDFTDQLYKAGVSAKLSNADAFSVTNDELHQESLQKRISAGLGTAFDVGDFVLDVVPFGKLGKGLMALARQVNPRKVLSRLPDIHLLRKTGRADQAPFGVVRNNASVGIAGPLLKGYEVPFSSDALKHLKYNKADDIYADGANNQYIRIGNKYYWSNLQPDSNGKLQRGIFRPNNVLDRFDVERVDGKWVAWSRSERLLGGGAGKRPHDVDDDGASAPKRVSGNTPNLNLPDGGFGGKVIDQRADPLPYYSYAALETPQVIDTITRQTKQRLDDLYGKDQVEIIGYHISPAKNKASLRKDGFSSNINEGQGEGVAGHNIYGPGMYLSTKPTNAHMSKDGLYTMYAVCRPKNVPWGRGVKPQMWDVESNASLRGDFIDGATGELKINPAGIPKVGLMEIGEASLRRRGPDSSSPIEGPRPRPATLTYEQASIWAREKVQNPKYSGRFKAIQSETDDKTRDKLIEHLAKDMLADYPESDVRLPHLKKWLDDNAKQATR
ncbi:DUF6543 domain-containing protein [Collimonas sp. H4R21]|uniref:DUF6543 domain-containing protein n=1 Tax=Collimonas rhizosphaerae TaxID=3126357 RepID=A0ABU9PYR7_9BURK